MSSGIEFFCSIYLVRKRRLDGFALAFSAFTGMGGVSNLSEADPRQATLSNANLNGAKLERVTVEDAN